MQSITSNLEEQGICFRLLGSGAEKEVYQAVGPLGDHNQEVYLVAKRSIPIFNGLKEEIHVASKIKFQIYLQGLKDFFISHGKTEEESVHYAKKLVKQFPTPEALKEGLKEDKAQSEGTELFREYDSSRLLDCYRYLALDFSPSFPVHGKPAWSAPLAENNLENAIRERQYGWKESSALAGHLIQGFRSLHDGGYIHGDPKLDNILLYKTKEGMLEARLGDWGKARKMADDEVGIHLGNRRHMPPERLCSKKGEVFGVGMMLVRLLEEELLQDQKVKMLIEPKEEWIDPQKRAQLRFEADPTRQRKGIERFLSILAIAPEIDAKSIDVAIHIALSMAHLAAFSSEKQLELDQAISDYLDALEDQLQKKYPDEAKEIRNTVAILRGMLQSDPYRRISMKIAGMQWRMRSL